MMRTLGRGKMEKEAVSGALQWSSWRSAEGGVEAVADLRGGQRPAHEPARRQRNDQGEG